MNDKPVIVFSPIRARQTAAALAASVYDAYVNHADSCVDGTGNVFAIAAQDGAGATDLDAVVKKRDAATGVWAEIARYTQVEYGKAGYGSVAVRGADLVVLLSRRNAENQQVVVEEIIEGVAVPFVTRAELDALWNYVKHQERLTANLRVIDEEVAVQVREAGQRLVAAAEKFDQAVPPARTP